MSTQLNRKRFALSVAVIGALGTPIWTGSLKTALRSSWSSWWSVISEDDEDRYLAAHGLNPFDFGLACIINEMPDHPDARRRLTDVERERADVERERQNKICNEASGLRGQNVVVQSRVFNPAPLLRPLIRDLLLGFLAPFLLVLFVPRVVGAYFRWVTSPPK